MIETDKMREDLIQERSRRILEEAWPEADATIGGAQVSADTLLMAKLLARISAQQEMMLKELRGIHGHVGTVRL